MDEPENAITTIEWLTSVFSMDEIAKMSGLSVSTIRRMFDGKVTHRTWLMLAPVLKAAEDSEYRPDELMMY